MIAPGCEVRDDGEGAYIANIDETAVEPVFTAELLQSTVSKVRVTNNCVTVTLKNGQAIERRDQL